MFRPAPGGRCRARLARPIHDKLLLLPNFLWQGVVADSAQITAGLRLTEHFLLHHVLLPQGRVLPPARGRLTQRMLQRPAAATIGS